MSTAVASVRHSTLAWHHERNRRDVEDGEVDDCATRTATRTRDHGPHTYRGREDMREDDRGRYKRRSPDHEYIQRRKRPRSPGAELKDLTPQSKMLQSEPFVSSLNPARGAKDRIFSQPSRLSSSSYRLHGHSDDRSRLTTCDDSPTSRYRRYRQTLRPEGDNFITRGRQEEVGDICDVASSLTTRKRDSCNRRISSPSPSRPLSGCNLSAERCKPAPVGEQGQVSRDNQIPLHSHLDRHNKGRDKEMYLQRDTNHNRHPERRRASSTLASYNRTAYSHVEPSEQDIAGAYERNWKASSSPQRRPSFSTPSSDSNRISHLSAAPSSSVDERRGVPSGRSVRREASVDNYHASLSSHRGSERSWQPRGRSTSPLPQRGDRRQSRDFSDTSHGETGQYAAKQSMRFGNSSFAVRHSENRGLSNSPSRSIRYDERRRSSRERQRTYAGKRSHSIERPSSPWKSRTAAQYESRLRSRSRSPPASFAGKFSRDYGGRRESSRARLQEKHSRESSFRSDIYRHNSCEHLPTGRSPSPIIPSSRHFEGRPSRADDQDHKAWITRKQMVGRLTRHESHPTAASLKQSTRSLWNATDCDTEASSLQKATELSLDSSHRRNPSLRRDEDDPKRIANRSDELHNTVYAASNEPRATHAGEDYKISSPALRYAHSGVDFQKAERRSSVKTSTAQSNRSAEPPHQDSWASRSLGSRWCPPRASEEKVRNTKADSLVSAACRASVSPRGNEIVQPEEATGDRKGWRTSLSSVGSVSTFKPCLSQPTGDISAKKSFPATANNHRVKETSQHQHQSRQGAQEPRCFAQGRTPICPQPASSQLLSKKSAAPLTSHAETPFSSHQQDENDVLSEKSNSQGLESQPATASVLVSASPKPTTAKKQTTTKSSLGIPMKWLKPTPKKKVSAMKKDDTTAGKLGRVTEKSPPKIARKQKLPTLSRDRDGQQEENLMEIQPKGEGKTAVTETELTDVFLKSEEKPCKSDVKKSQRPMKKRFIREGSPEQKVRSSTNNDTTVQPNLLSNIEKSRSHAVQKEPSKQFALARPSSPSANANHRTVTDSEGGSTVSGINRDIAVSNVIVRMDKKCDGVPIAIVRGNVVDMAGSTPDLTADDSLTASMELDQTPATRVPDVIVPRNGVGHCCPEDDDMLLDSPQHQIDGTDTRKERAQQTAASESVESSSESDNSTSDSDDDSDTDDEEVMMWAAKMFGINPAAQPMPRRKAKSFTPELETTQPWSDVGKPKLHLRISLSKSTKSGEQDLVEPRPEDDCQMLQHDTRPKTECEARRRKKPKKLKKRERLSSEPDKKLNEEEVGPVKSKEKATRKRDKKMRKKLRKILNEKHLVQESVEEDDDALEREMVEERRKREQAKPLTAAQIRAILGEDWNGGDGSSRTSNWVRRSTRQPLKSILNSKQMKTFLHKVRNNDPDMVVLKMKKYISDPNAPEVVLNAALEALEENTNCEALYIQNFNNGMRDSQVLHLLRILQQPKCKIWNLNIGETYNVSDKTWEAFTNGLKRTKVTHMYASEHTITGEMKDEIRETIRKNRSKHDMHINPNNLDVIIQCTHCWWNPINAKALRPYLKNKGYEHILHDKEAQGLKGSMSAAPVK